MFANADFKGAFCFANIILVAGALQHTQDFYRVTVDKLFYFVKKIPVCITEGVCSIHQIADVTSSAGEHTLEFHVVYIELPNKLFQSFGTALPEQKTHPCSSTIAEHGRGTFRNSEQPPLSLPCHFFDD